MCEELLANMSDVACAAVGLGVWGLRERVRVLYRGWWSPQQPLSHTSSSLIYNSVKGPVRTATSEEDICHDVCQAAGNALLTHAHTNTVTQIQAEYQRV